MSIGNSASRHMMERTAFSILTDTGSNNMPYLHITARTASESYIMINDGKTALTTANNYFAVLYRTSNHHTLEMFITKNGQTGPGTHSNKQIATVKGGWQLAIWPIGGWTNYDTTGLGWSRLDVLNPTVGTGHEMDIAFAGFFQSYDEIAEYYGEYAQKYFGESGCAHPEKCYEYRATGDGLTYDQYCACGKLMAKNVTGVTGDGLKLFDAQEVLSRGEGDGGTNYSVTTMTEGGLSFARFKALTTKTSGNEWFFWIVNNDETDISGVSDYFAIVYRTSSGYNPSVELFISNNDTLDGSHKRAYTMSTSGQWHVAVFDLSGCTGYNDIKDVVSRFRLDIFNSGNEVKADEYIDIAYMGFYSSTEVLHQDYALMAEKYGMNAQYKVYLDKGHAKLDGSATVLSGGKSATNKPVEIDAAGLTLTKTNSLGIGGWCVTPSGVKEYVYRVVKVDGVKLESPDVIGTFKGSNSGTSNAGVTAEGLKLNYPVNCNLGAGWQSCHTFDLAGYEGKTVDVELVAVTNYGYTAVLVQINSIKVPG